MSAIEKTVSSNSTAFYNKIAAKAVQLYYPTFSSVRLLNHSENITYLAERKNGNPAILRLNRPGYHTKTELEAELIWMEAIKKDTSIVLPEPIAGSNGKLIQAIPGIHTNGQTVHCMMFTFLEGETPDENNEQDLFDYFERLGEITAQLHHHVEHWEKARSICRPVWDYDTMIGKEAKWGRWQDGIGITPDHAQLFEKTSAVIHRRLKRFGKSSDRFGLIHADLRLTNLLVYSNHQLKVIDFDDCGFSWFLYDLAAALSFIEHKAYVSDLIHEWLKGYRKIRTIPKEQEAEIPTFIMLRRLMLIGWIGSHTHNETAQNLGATYTNQTVPLAEKYLAHFN